MKRYAGLHWLIPLLAKRFKVLEGLENIPPSGPCILAGNHVGSPDPIFIGAATFQYTGRPITFISYDRAVHVFGERRAYAWLGMVKKVEDRPSEALTTLRRELEVGNVVGIFPEGMRSAAPFLLPGKTGAARLAHWTGAPVVPFGFGGPSTWTFNQGLRATLAFRKDMSLRVGKPLTFPVIEPEHLTKEQLLKTTRTIMAAIGVLAGRPSPY